jgi:hypothetical protein
MIQRKICETTKENGTRRSKINHDLYKLNKEPQIVRLIGGGRFWWLGQKCGSTGNELYIFESTCSVIANVTIRWRYMHNSHM